MMKLGEVAGRLSTLDVLAPGGVEVALAIANRNLIIRRYDEIDRDQTWLTLCADLPAWRALHSSLCSPRQEAALSAAPENADPGVAPSRRPPSAVRRYIAGTIEGMHPSIEPVRHLGRVAAKQFRGRS
jgi:hypothetical protein